MAKVNGTINGLHGVTTSKLLLEILKFSEDAI